MSGRHTICKVVLDGVCEIKAARKRDGGEAWMEEGTTPELFRGVDRYLARGDKISPGSLDLTCSDMTALNSSVSLFSAVVYHLIMYAYCIEPGRGSTALTSVLMQTGTRSQVKSIELGISPVDNDTNTQLHIGSKGYCIGIPGWACNICLSVSTVNFPRLPSREHPCARRVVGRPWSQSQNAEAG